MNDSGWAFFMRTWNLVLQTALTGVVDRKLQALPSLTYAVDKDTFGVSEEPHSSKAAARQITGASVKSST